MAAHAAVSGDYNEKLALDNELSYVYIEYKLAI